MKILAIVCLAIVYWLSVLLLCTDNISDLSPERKKKMKTAIKITIATIFIWSFVFFISNNIYTSADIPPDTTRPCKQDDNNDKCTAEAPCCLGNVKIYTQENIRYGELGREEAIKFGLEKIDTTIDYLFIAAAGIFAILAKIVIEPIASPNPIEYLTAWIIWLITNTAALSVASVISGFVARLDFNSAGNVRGFSIYGALGVGMLNQIFLLLVALIFLIITIVKIIVIRKRKGA